MGKIKLYLFTLIGISVIVVSIGLGSFRYMFNSTKSQLLKNKMESGEREAREVGRLLEQQLEMGIPPQKVIEHLQLSILNTDAQSEFLCMYNKQGIEICHPNIALVGQKITTGNSAFLKNSDSSVYAFSDILYSGKAIGGLRTFPDAKNRSSEIVNVFPVHGSDWMVATHFNIELLQDQFSSLYKQFIIGFFVMAFLIISCCFILIRLIYHKYEKTMALEIDHLNVELNELAVLNQQLEFAKESNQQFSKETIIEEENFRKRLVTYQKDEMVSLEIQDAALFYLEENNIFVKTFLAKEFKINQNLDELMKQLDNSIFYRANRQYIVNVNAIKTILIYGKNQLCLITNPQSKEDIIISKNRVAEFKKWLDQ